MCFQKQEDAQRAKNDAPKQPFNGKNLKVYFAEKKEVRKAKQDEYFDRQNFFQFQQQRYPSQGGMPPGFNMQTMMGMMEPFMKMLPQMLGNQRGGMMPRQGAGGMPYNNRMPGNNMPRGGGMRGGMGGRGGHMGAPGPNRGGQ